MTNGANIGTQGLTWAILGGEIMTVIFDLRWMLLLIGVLIATDFWWGSKEAWKRYEETKDEKYKWRFSRAGRRSLNKLVDFITYLLIGATLGMAIFEPLEICDHTTTAAIALGAGGLFDLSSITGHVCYIHNIDTKGGILKILWRIVIRLAKTKSPELGEALEAEITNDDIERNSSEED